MEPANCTANLQSTAPFVIFVCLQAVIIALGIFGNSLVVVAVYKSSTLQIVSNYFIVSLAVADILVGLLVSPLYITLLSLRLWVSDHALYKVENFFWVQSLVATTYSLCAISVDRWLALSKVYAYRTLMTQRRARAIIVAVWLFSFALASSVLLIKGNDSVASVIWNICTFSTVGIPLTLIVFCYFRIFQITRQQQRRISMRCFPSHLQTEKHKQFLKNKKAAGTIGIVIGFFVLLFTPNLVFSCVEISTKDECEKRLVYRHWVWGIVMAHISSVVNPIVYAARSREFRAAFRRVLKR